MPITNLLRLSCAIIALLALTPLQAEEPAALDRIVAVVNEDAILQSDLDNMLHAVRAQLRRQDIETPPPASLRKQVLERLIVSRLQLQQAAAAGIRADDDTLNEALGNLARENKLSPQEFRVALEQDGFNYARFRETIRDQITITRLQQRQVNTLINVTDREVENFLSQEKFGDIADQFRLAHILIAVPEAAKSSQLDTARKTAVDVLDKLRAGADFSDMAVEYSNGQQALEGGDLGWRPLAEIPSLFVDRVPTMKPGEISDLIRSPSGFHIIKLIDRRGLNQHVVTQTHLRQILLRGSELLSDTDAEERLEKLKERIEGGDDFTALARAHSEDTVSAVQGGDLGWLSPGALPPEFEQAIAGLPPGTVSAPFKTAIGWHIAEVLARRQHEDTPEYQRSRPRELIRARKAEEELQLWLRRLRDEAYIENRLVS